MKKLKKILCKIFGHRFPTIWPGHSLYFDGEANCLRCGISFFGEDPYKNFGGKENFFKNNHVI